MASINLLTQLYNDFIIVLQQTVIKYTVLADKYETLEMKKAADAYIVASLMEDKFETYYRYDKTIIAELMGLNIETQRSEIDKYYYDNTLIPYNMRESFLLAQRKKIIDEYVEKNNYYRMLNGLPDIEDTEDDFIYVDDETATTYSISRGTPIHLLPPNEVSTLKNSGKLDEIIAAHPDKSYLKFIGNNRINIIEARRAKNFAVLKIPSSVTDAMWDQFALMYEQCREYFMSCIYIPEYRQTIDYYDNFIALCIMVMTIQQVIARVIKNTIDRDFFDEYCVRVLFSVYGVPYYGQMDASTRRQVIQDLNILVQNKGTNKVLYDIASILGYDRMKIYKYYLVRSRRFGSDGVPITSYKTDENGDQVLDYQAMYDVYFQRVGIGDMDTYMSILDLSNRVSYAEVTGADPFWIEDADLLKELYESEYNFVETKYLGLNISYRLTQVLFDNAYIMRMIFDKKNEIPGIMLDLPKVSSTSQISLFDTIVLLCAFLCKQNHLKGEILTLPSKILHVLGFNFNVDFEKIRQDILANPYIDDALAEYLTQSTTYTAEGINSLYKNMMDLFHGLVDRMVECEDIEAYEAYKKLYYTIYYTDENQTVFKIGTDEDGNPIYAETFLQYLEAMTPDLYTLVTETPEAEIPMYVSHICSKVSSLIPEVHYFGATINTSEEIEKMLVGLIRFFKSYTTDMIGLNTVYILELKPELIIKLIDRILIHANLRTDDELHLSYADYIELHNTIIANNRLRLHDMIQKIVAAYQIFESLIIHDELHYLHANYLVWDDLILTDKIQQIIVNIDLDEYIRYGGLLDEIHHIYCNILLLDILRITDKLHELNANLLAIDENSFYDIINSIQMSFGIKDYIAGRKGGFLRDRVNDLFMTYLLSTKLNFSDRLKFINEVFSMYDQSFKPRDWVHIINTLEIETGFALTDEIKYIGLLLVCLDRFAFSSAIKYIAEDIEMNDTSLKYQDWVHIIMRNTLKTGFVFSGDIVKYIKAILVAPTTLPLTDQIKSIKKFREYDEENGTFFDIANIVGTNMCKNPCIIDDKFVPHSLVDQEDHVPFHDACTISYSE